MRLVAPGALARVFVACLLACAPAFGGDAGIRPDLLAAADAAERIYFFAGLDVSQNSAFGWAGIASAPFGRLDEDGVRLRLAGGTGRYRYRTSAVPGGINEGNVASGEILLGFHRSLGSASATAYLGAHMEEQRLTAADPGNAAAGTALGAKATLEFFRRLDPLWVASASASASTVHRAYQVRATLAREFDYGLGAGVEAVVLGDARYVEPRAGLSGSMTYGRGVLTITAGLLFSTNKGGGGYATLSLHAPY
ncbi:MAG TPA: cellulose biosynthesis protein BcsS [Xanthobacteraceae bacterium]